MPTPRDYYLLLKASGLCVTCKATRKDHRVHCDKCRERNKKNEKRWRDTHKQDKSSQNRRWRLKQKHAGRCGRCGDTSDTPTCQGCRDYLRRRYRKTLAGKELRPRSCTMCRGAVGPERHNRSACPMRFVIDRNEYALARPGAGY